MTTSLVLADRDETGGVSAVEEHSEGMYPNIDQLPLTKESSPPLYKLKLDPNEERAFEKPPSNNQFAGMTREELEAYINDPYWQRVRKLLSAVYVLVMIGLIIGSVLIVILKPRCPPKPKRAWFEQEIIYELDVRTWKDSDNDGIGDFGGVQEKLDYMEKNNVKSILLASSPFPRTGTAISSPSLLSSNLLETGGDTTKAGARNKKQPQTSFQTLLKTLVRKDMHLLIDLPLSSTNEPDGSEWYGQSDDRDENSPSLIDLCSPPYKQQDPACQYVTKNRQYPLDFSDGQVAKVAGHRLNHWLSTMKIDGVRVDVPLKTSTNTESKPIVVIALDVVYRWKQIAEKVRKRTLQTKLLLFDVPSWMQQSAEYRIDLEKLNDNTVHSIMGDHTSRVTASALFRRFQRPLDYRKPLPKFWQLGSRTQVTGGQNASKEMLLTMGLLFAGTPLVLYGEELGIDQSTSPLMPWSPDAKTHNGFTSCTQGSSCDQLLKKRTKHSPLSNTSVKRQEAVGGEESSLLALFRRLSKLREQNSFQFGVFKAGQVQKENIFWFIREAQGHPGYVTILNMNPSGGPMSHISLAGQASSDRIPAVVHYEYQWPKVYLPTQHGVHIHADNLLIPSHSITILSWPAKLNKKSVKFPLP